MTTHQLDVLELYRWLDTKRRADDMSWRRLAAQLGLSSSTLTRLGQGHRPDADALVTLMAWLDIDIAYVTKPSI
ncbi:helix-turn-helix domain-containing protein [Streptomyces xanthophaeus]